MRIGLISDIHSNIDALHAVYQEFEERQVDKVICLGDIIGLGAHPEECIQFLKNHQDKILSIVKGNHEDYLLKEKMEQVAPELPVKLAVDVKTGRDWGNL